MSILSRYLLARFLGWFVAIFSIFALITSMADALINFDELFEAGATPLAAFQRLLLRLPADYLQFLIPLAAFAAGLVSLGLAARSREISAIKAGGISPLRPVIGILVAACVLSGLTLALTDTLGVEASRRLRAAEGNGAEIVFRRGSFWYHRGDVIYNIRDSDRETRTLRGVGVFETDQQGRLARSIQAESALIESPSRWRLFSAAIRSFDPADPLAPPRFERREELEIGIAAPTAHTLLDANATTLSLRDLRQYVDARSRQGEDVGRARALLHGRLAEPWSALLFTLFAVPLALRVEHTRSLAVAGLQGIGLVAAFWFLRGLGATLASEGVVPPSATPWVILALFLGIGLWRLARVPK